MGSFSLCADRNPRAVIAETGNGADLQLAARSVERESCIIGGVDRLADVGESGHKFETACVADGGNGLIAINTIAVVDMEFRQPDDRNRVGMGCRNRQTGGGDGDDRPTEKRIPALTG